MFPELTSCGESSLGSGDGFDKFGFKGQDFLVRSKGRPVDEENVLDPFTERCDLGRLKVHAVTEEHFADRVEKSESVRTDDG